MASEKMNSLHAAHIESVSSISPPADEKVHIGEDKDIAQYAGTEIRPVDEETSKKLFWTVNRRILACMLGVCCAR